MRRRPQSPILKHALALSIVAFLTIGVLEGATPLSGSQPIAAAVVLVIENRMEVLRNGSSRWDPSHLGQELDAGDQGRTFANSRATLRLFDQSIASMNESTAFRIESPPDGSSRPIYSLLKGSIYFLHRGNPMNFRVTTPVVNASIRGTEFILEHDEARGTRLSVVEGEVDLTASDGSNLILHSGEEAVAAPGVLPVRTPFGLRPQFADWRLYYPAILDPTPASFRASISTPFRRSLASYDAGDVQEAIRLLPDLQAAQTPSDELYIASLELSAGQVERMESRLRRLPDDLSSAASALRLLRRVIGGNPPALESTANPTAADHLSRSYYHQSLGHLIAARSAARDAIRASPDFGFAWSRLAELEFGFGETGRAQEAIRKSLLLSPRNAEAHALDGFLLAADGRIDAAAARFDQSILLNGASANAWLGRGLCRFRQGRPTEGISDLLTAAAIEPTRSIIRSYLAKGWQILKHPELSFRELKFAAELDPHDPTPWLYQALLLRDELRFNEAITASQASLRRNDNRAVFRSRFLLDQDMAVRSSTLASAFREAGIPFAGFSEAAKAVDANFADASAHLFMAEALDAQRDPSRFNLRLETPWFNEKLLSTLLAPPGAVPLSQNISLQEYARLFVRNHAELGLASSYRSDGQFRQNASQFGLVEGTAWSVDADYQNNRGVRPNNKLDRLETYLTVKQKLGPHDSILTLLKFQDFESGDNFQYEDPSNARLGYSFEQDQRPLLGIGYNKEWSPGHHSLVLIGRLENDATYRDAQASLPLLGTNVSSITDVFAPVPYRYRYELNFRSNFAEWMELLERESYGIILGSRFNEGAFEAGNDFSSLEAFDGSNPSILGSLNGALRQRSLYAYPRLRLADSVTLTVGLAYEQIGFPDTFLTPPASSVDGFRRKLSPKVALSWEPDHRWSFRGIYAQGLGGMGFDQSYRLEPAVLAGFIQSDRAILSESLAGAVAGAPATTAGLAVDLKPSSKTFVSLQADQILSAARRSNGALAIDSTLGGSTNSVLSSTPERLAYEENTVGMNAGWLLSDEVVISANYRFTRSSLRQDLTEIPISLLGEADQLRRSELHEAGVRLRFHHPNGFFAGAETEYRWQANEHRSYFKGSPVRTTTSESFPQLNVSAGYRSHAKRVEASLDLLNLTGENYRLSPLTPYSELPRKRVLLVRIGLRF